MQVYRLRSGARCGWAGKPAQHSLVRGVVRQRGILRAPGAGAEQTSAPTSSQPKGEARSHETEIVVIGSGIGGLCCAAMLAKYGHKVTVAESHYTPGGAAHSYQNKGYHFESGPSLYSGMTGKGKEANPLGHVLQAIGEPLDCKYYNTWNVLVPEGTFLTQVGNDNFGSVLSKIRGPEAVQEWNSLQELMRPLASAAAALPPAAMRLDPWAAITVGRYLPDLITQGPVAAQLTGPFANILDKNIKDPFIKNWMNLLCFLLSGLPANGTIAAEIAYMFNEWYRPNCSLEFPMGGSQAMVSALVRGLEKRGGRLLLNSHVERIISDDNRGASGVVLRGGGTIKATEAVVSNASVWDTVKMLPPSIVPEQWRRERVQTPPCPSFMHLHLGFDATGLDDLELHHIVVNSWDKGVDAEQNVVLISIASVMDPSLAPAGKHCLHAYLPATEPYALWEGLDRKSDEYKKLKEERSQVLWSAVERIIPDIRSRVEVSAVGTPLTHQRYLRRHRGSYGPAISAGDARVLPVTTPIPRLYCTGDGTFPGIGLPAVAASGAITANTLSPITEHWRMLDEIGV
uniref:Carotene synthesis related protein n=1 Tax=Dunaliella salina TaxID=3046 RepID=A0A6H0XIJ0_DUNSA|nr:carotene synthesis related protein [Dunaliella salina]